MDIYKRYVCKCGRWRRTSGKCPACGEKLQQKGWGWRIKKVPGPGYVSGSATSKGKAVTDRDLALRGCRHEVGDSKARATFNFIAQDFIVVVSEKQSRNGARDKESYRNVKVSNLGELILDLWQQRDVQLWINAREDYGAAPATIIKELGFVKRVFKYAKRNDYNVSPDPFDGLRVPHVVEKELKLCSHDEEQALWEALPKSSLPYYKFLAETGGRMSEVLNLKKVDIDFANSVAWVWSAKTRSHTPERQPLYLSEEATEILAEMIDRFPDHEYVFINPVTNEPYKHPKSTLKRAYKKIGLEMRSVHDLRHLYGTRLTEAGVPTLVVAELMRHKQIKMTQRYTHLSKQVLFDALSTKKSDRNATVARNEKKQPPK